MKISVICPIFNSGIYLQRTINSLLNQTMTPYEIIFSDDGSIDNSIEIIKRNFKSFQKKNIKINLLLNKHSGPGKNRNIAMSNATGDWFAFLDSDDTWEYNKVELLNKFRQRKDQANFFLNWEIFHKKNNKSSLLRHGDEYNHKIDLSNQLYAKNFFSTSAVTMHKSLFLKYGGFDICLPNAQDYEYWLKISKGINLYIIKEFLGKYYETKGNITQRPYRKKIKSLIKISYRYRKFVGNKNFFLKLIQIILSKEWVKNILNFNL